MEITVEELLKKDLQNKIIIFQTDTVYGIGCLLDNESAVNKIYDIKQRDQKNPLAVLCSSVEEIQTLIQEYEVVKPLAQRYWPGALTLICEKTSRVPSFVTRGFNTVGVRIPNDSIALQILRHFGPMAVTSLNISTEPPITSYQDALVFADQVDFIVRGTDVLGTSSTVYDPVKKIVYRQGDVTIE